MIKDITKSHLNKCYVQKTQIYISICTGTITRLYKNKDSDKISFLQGMINIRSILQFMLI